MMGPWSGFPAAHHREPTPSFSTTFRPEEPLGLAVEGPVKPTGLLGERRNKSRTVHSDGKLGFPGPQPCTKTYNMENGALSSSVGTNRNHLHILALQIQNLSHKEV